MKKLIQTLLEQASRDSVERFVAGGIITNKTNKILVLKRASDDFMPNIYELPSGRVDGEEGILDTLKREVKEETNLTVTNILKYSEHFDYQSKSGKLTRQFNFHVETENKVVTLSDEHEGYAWITQSEMKNYNITESVQKIINFFYSNSVSDEFSLFGKGASRKVKRSDAEAQEVEETSSEAAKKRRVEHQEEDVKEEPQFCLK